MGRRGYPPEFRRKILDLVEAGRTARWIAWNPSQPHPEPLRQSLQLRTQRLPGNPVPPRHSTTDAPSFMTCKSPIALLHQP
jgi:hypothetical protein